jgi:hypothetical protein
VAVDLGYGNSHFENCQAKVKENPWNFRIFLLNLNLAKMRITVYNNLSLWYKLILDNTRKK